MKLTCLTMGFVAVFALQSFAPGDDPIFSGPQVGEALPPLPVTSVLGESAGEEFDVLQKAGDKPVLLVFVNGRTRPGFGLTNLLMRYTGSREKQDLYSGVIILTDDATTTKQWVGNVQKHLSADTATYAISKEGKEGPGAYGLNRNVELTILVGAEGKVTANFALVQPSIEADGPKVLKAIVDVTGGGEVPTIAQLGGDGYRNREMKKRGAAQRGGGEDDPKIRQLLRGVINRQATPDDVNAAVVKIEEYVVKNEAARQQLGRMASTVVNSGKLDSYGTKPAQEALRKWAKEYGPSPEEKKGEGKPQE